MARVIVLCGLPGCGKSSWAFAAFGDKADMVILSRDALGTGARVTDLMPAAEAALDAGKSVCFDNTHVTRESRHPWIELARRRGIDARVVWFDVPFEQCQIQVLRRQWRAYHALFMDGRPRLRTEADFVGPTRPRRNPTAADAAGIFPIAAMYRARKLWQPPTEAEGFAVVERVATPAPVWPGATYTKRAVVFDMDGTLRVLAPGSTNDKYPTDPDEVRLAPGVTGARLQTLQDAGWLLFAVSNQSGIAAGTVSAEAVAACMDRTVALLRETAPGLEIRVYWCPHRAGPVTCYCRKPQSGWAVGICEAFKVAPARSVMIGDMTSDRTWAERMGMRFVEAAAWQAVTVDL